MLSHKLAYYILIPLCLGVSSFGMAGLALLGQAGSQRGASGGFGGVRGGFLGGTGINPDALRLGHRLDNKHYRERYTQEKNFDWRQARKRGLTAQEFYGSPVSGGGSPGVSGGAQVLGNMATTTAANKIQPSCYLRPC